MRFMEPTIATVVTNPTNRDLKYTWLSKNGMFVKAKSSVTVPYCVYTDATPSQRSQLGEAMRAKMVKLEYLVRGAQVTQVDSLSTSIIYGRPKTRAVKPSPAPAPAPAPVAPPPAAPAPQKKESRRERRRREKKEAKKEATMKPRTQIITAVGDGKDAAKDSVDIVQKATGQQTVSMQEAMGWDIPPSKDPRMPQATEAVTMNDAITEGVGDPLEKAAAAAEKEKKVQQQKDKLAAARTKTPARTTKTLKSTTDVDTAAAAAKKKRSEAAKKAAITRKKNQEAKKKQ